MLCSDLGWLLETGALGKPCTRNPLPEHRHRRADLNKVFFLNKDRFFFPISSLIAVKVFTLTEVR